jgi:exonuclease SbcC
MKPHRLKISAFLAYGGVVEVNFDALADSGIFLVYGDTGAGKTTIFDAMAYAIFGSLPGSRKGSKLDTLRSHHASSSTPTYVEFEATVGNERVLITRNPTYTRPKKSGTGTTEEKAGVTLSKWNGAGWEPWVTQAGATEDEIRRWIKLEAEQFFKLILLPQGEFAAFLRAKSSEREEILSKLFNPYVFENIQEWFVNRKRSLEISSSDAEIAVTTTRSRIAGAMSVSIEEVQSIEWLDGIIAKAGTEIPALQELEKNAIADFQVAVDAEAAALKIAGDLEQRALAQAAFDQAMAAWESLRAEHVKIILKSWKDDAIQERLNEIVTAKTVELDKVKSKAEKIESLYEERDELEDLEDSLTSEADEKNSLTEKLKESEPRLKKLQESQDALPALTEEVGKLTAEIKELNRALEALDDLAQAEKDFASAGEKISVAEEKVASFDEKKNQAQEKFEKSQAGELARHLENGHNCPVCGSKEHPAPAQFSDESNRDAWKKAEDLFNKAAKELGDLKAQAAIPQTTIAKAKKDLKEFPKATKESITKKITELSSRLKVANATIKSAGNAKKEFDSLIKEITKDKSRIEVIAANAKSGKTAKTKAQTSISKLEKALGIETGEEIDAPDADELESEIGIYSKLIQSVSKVLENLNSTKSVLENAPVVSKDQNVDVATLKAAREAQGLIKDEASAAIVEQQRVVKELADNRDAFSTATSAHESLKNELSKLLLLSEHITGRIGRRIPLVHYYLSAKLEQVLFEANHRLLEITDQRYSLFVKSDNTGRGQQALTIAVRDAWTGEERLADSLSGGETFICSLALALGLADAVKQGHGLESLFIDEGFGTLDQTYLQNVMSSLDRLRSSGKLVGIISHVTELRQRIPTQLHVIKGQSGSTLELTSNDD